MDNFLGINFLTIPPYRGGAFNTPKQRYIQSFPVDSASIPKSIGKNLGFRCALSPRKALSDGN